MKKNNALVLLVAKIVADLLSKDTKTTVDQLISFVDAKFKFCTVKDGPAELDSSASTSFKAMKTRYMSIPMIK